MVQTFRWLTIINKIR